MKHRFCKHFQIGPKFSWQRVLSRGMENNKGSHWSLVKLWPHTRTSLWMLNLCQMFIFSYFFWFLKDEIVLEEKLFSSCVALWKPLKNSEVTSLEKSVLIANVIFNINVLWFHQTRVSIIKIIFYYNIGLRKHWKYIIHSQ